MTTGGSEQWGYPEVAAHLGTAQSTVRKYAAKEFLPEPDGRIGGSPWWWADTIRAWHEQRPGRGVGGGRPRKLTG